MANSSELTGGEDGHIDQYNDLRADVLNTSTGHTHNSTDSKTLATDSVDTSQIVAGAVDTAELATGAVDTAELATGAVDTNKLGTGATFESAITRFFVIDPSDVRAAGGVLPSDDGAGAAKWSIPVVSGDVFGFHLPEGTIIIRIEMYAYSSQQASEQSITVDIRRNVYASNGLGDMAQAGLNWTNNEAASFKSAPDTSIIDATIDYGTNSYFGIFTVVAANGYPRFTGLVVTYTTAAPLP